MSLVVDVIHVARIYNCEAFACKWYISGVKDDLSYLHESNWAYTDLQWGDIVDVKF